MNSFNEDPYIILGLLPGASEKKIRKAYRRLAKRYHPDKNPDNPEVHPLRIRQTLFSAFLQT
jgi:curved DNA-binding protein CbpA